MAYYMLNTVENLLLLKDLGFIDVSAYQINTKYIRIYSGSRQYCLQHLIGNYRAFLLDQDNLCALLLMPSRELKRSYINSLNLEPLND